MEYKKKKMEAFFTIFLIFIYLFLIKISKHCDKELAINVFLSPLKKYVCNEITRMYSFLNKISDHSIFQIENFVYIRNWSKMF